MLRAGTTKGDRLANIDIVPIIPFDEGVAQGKALGRTAMRQGTDAALRGRHLRRTLGAMSRAMLARQAMARLETLPDYGRYPELQDIYPERLDELRGLASGAGCTLEEAAVYSYVVFRQNIADWHRKYQVCREPDRCSGVMFDGPDGVIGGQSAEDGPPPAPAGYRWQPPGPWAALRQRRPARPPLVLRKPRTGYIENWGVGNEKGVGCFCSVSCGVLLDEQIEDTWPIGAVPLLRFAGNVRELARLYEHYKLHNWGRQNQIWADTTGDAVAVENSFRRIGLRWIGPDRTLWVTEGHYESPEMFAYMRDKRLAYIHEAGKDLGSEDMQYATDSHVRFTRLAELCHLPLGRGYKHIRRVLTDHAPFPRAVCRHGGPDTAPYDRSVTMASWFSDLTHNRRYSREWIPWKKFPCEVPETVIEYPARNRRSATRKPAAGRSRR
jgi:hypothetical protein